jgi:ribosome maturation factor RimP
VEVHRGRGRLLARFYIDHDRGVTVEDCAQISRTIERLLDARDPIEGAYTLEVSSPGIERPLRREEDFQAFAGREVKVQTQSPIDGRSKFSGILLGITDGSVIVRGEGDEEFRIPRDAVKKARLVYRQIP